jgi:hypothetical protein
MTCIGSGIIQAISKAASLGGGGELGAGLELWTFAE